MNQKDTYQELIEGAMAGRYSRRMVLRRAAMLGLSFPAIAALLAACGGDDDDDTTTTTTATTGTGGTTATATRPSGGAATPGGTPRATPGGTPSGTPRATPAGGAGTPAGSPAGTPGASGSMDDYSIDSPPPVPNAEAASEYSGQSITYIGGQVGLDAEVDNALARRFTEDTGIQVEVIAGPAESTERYSQYLRFFQGQSADVDVMTLDVIWPGALAPHLVDLTDALGEEAQLHYESLIENNTIDGKLVAMPWFVDFGMLYYRTDLLEKYGFDGPPETWDELQEMAQTIVDGEVGSNSEFTGFVFQGNAYEGLTCNALEWLASSGGGTIIDENGEVTLNNEEAIAMLNKARGWIGTISPRGVTSYAEEDSRNVFQGGNAAFLRNWPYVYGLAGADDSPIQGKFDVAPLPANEGEDHVGTVGGWSAGVSTYSQAQEAGIEFVRYLTSAEVQTWRTAIGGSGTPTMPSVAEMLVVQEAIPYLTQMESVVRVTRPSRTTGENYNQVSTFFFQACNQVLNGTDASQAIPPAAQQIERVVG